MSSKMRWEQCCSEDGCTMPARYGELCSRCIFAVSPARRAVEMMDTQTDAIAPAIHIPALQDWDIIRAAEMMLGG
jgi:hypothetical protein